MSAIRTNAAAALLGVSPNTLRSWESRFGYPTPSRTEGGHRQFDLAEIEALRQAHAETQDIASAISLVRQRAEGPSTPARLCATFAEFSAEKADRLLEESMAVRSTERTVETVLLPGVEAMAPTSPEYCFAWRYATGWLAAAQRVAPPATREESVLVFDASRPMGMDGLYTQALELFLRRAGLRVWRCPSTWTAPASAAPCAPCNHRRWCSPDATPPWRRSDVWCMPQDRAAANYGSSTIAKLCPTRARARSSA